MQNKNRLLVLLLTFILKNFQGFLRNNIELGCQFLNKRQISYVNKELNIAHIHPMDNLHNRLKVVLGKKNEIVYYSYTLYYVLLQLYTIFVLRAEKVTIFELKM